MNSASKITIITDSASDMPGNLHNQVTVLPMTISFGDEQFEDGVTLSADEFYMKLIESDTLPKTSQVSPFAFTSAYETALTHSDAVIVITLSSKLSGTYQSACIAAGDYESEHAGSQGKIYIIDSENKESETSNKSETSPEAGAEYALKLINDGLSATAIADELNSAKKRIRLVALLDTLEYLKKGGRISSSAAFLGNVLKIKPVIAIDNGEVAILGKARGSKQGNNFLIEQVNTYGGIDYSMPVLLGYTGCSTELIDKYIKDSSSLWENKIPVPARIKVGATIGTHIGPGGITVAFFSTK